MRITVLGQSKEDVDKILNNECKSVYIVEGKQFDDILKLIHTDQHLDMNGSIFMNSSLKILETDGLV